MSDSNICREAVYDMNEIMYEASVELTNAMERIVAKASNRNALHRHIGYEKMEMLTRLITELENGI